MPQFPSGFLLDVDFVPANEEARYLALFGRLPFETVSMRGRLLRRQILAFGVGFGRNFQSIIDASPIPRELHGLRRRAAEWAGARSPELTQALVQRYPRGASIGFHRDAAVFGAPIVGISFGGWAQLRFRHEKGTRKVTVAIPPRSIYLLSSACRWKWLHAIAPVPELRYSVTFRMIAASSGSPN